MNLFEFDIARCLETLREGRLILYPTDTIWGIGCDATDEHAAEKIFALKKRDAAKSMIVLVADVNDIGHYAKAPSEEIKKMIRESERPLTVIYPDAKILAENIIAEDGSIAIRVVKDDFCATLIREFGKPIVSTSANISGDPSPKNYKDISSAVSDAVDHIVQYRQDEESPSVASRIVKWTDEEGLIVIRN